MELGISNQRGLMSAEAPRLGEAWPEFDFADLTGPGSLSFLFTGICPPLGQSCHFRGGRKLGLSRHLEMP